MKKLILGLVTLSTFLFATAQETKIEDPNASLNATGCAKTPLFSCRI